MKSFLKKVLSLFNLHVGYSSNHKRLLRSIDEVDVLLETILRVNGVSPLSSKSQLKQDIVCLIVSNFKRNGYFVEFGATDGVSLSNTYLLEKEFGWSGILAEPLPSWHQPLLNNRACTIDTRCVWSKSDEVVDFLAVNDGELSTISCYQSADAHSSSRERSSTIQVRTVSLLDLLDENHAPRYIDFLSIDTEGSELDILSAFDFSKYKFGFIAVEHNFTHNKEKIRVLLSRFGYRPMFDSLSKWDDWFIPS